MAGKGTAGQYGARNKFDFNDEMTFPDAFISIRASPPRASSFRRGTHEQVVSKASRRHFITVIIIIVILDY